MNLLISLLFVVGLTSLTCAQNTVQQQSTNNNRQGIAAVHQVIIANILKTWT